MHESNRDTHTHTATEKDANNMKKSTKQFCIKNDDRYIGEYSIINRLVVVINRLVN